MLFSSMMFLRLIGAESVKLNVVIIYSQKILVIALCVAVLSDETVAAPETEVEVVWSVNAGGDEHTDVHGIRSVQYRVLLLWALLYNTRASDNYIFTVFFKCIPLQLSEEWARGRKLMACLTP